MAQKKKVVIYGASVDPPGVHHRSLVELLSRRFDMVEILPCGPRPDKESVNDISPIHRAIMADLTFGDIPKVNVALDDLEKSVFTRTFDLYQRYVEKGYEVHLAIGTDLVQGGKDGLSVIQKEWYKGQELWDTAHWVVIIRDGYPIDTADYPPNTMGLDQKQGITGSSTEIRNRVFTHQPFEHLVVPRVADYMKRYALYRGMRPAMTNRKFSVDAPRLMIVVDENNPKAMELATEYRSYEDKENPNMIVVFGGDGMMLHAIRSYWRMRLPFFGVNAGHLGFRLNDPKLLPSLNQVFKNLVLFQSPLLYVEIITSDGETKMMLAHNDCWTRSVDGGQGAWTEIKVNGDVMIPKVVSDGILISTAAGSTAYARAMGAMPLYLHDQALLLVGNNVFMPSTFKSVHLPDDVLIELNPLDSGKRDVEGFVDGVSLGIIRKMTARISNIASVELVFHADQNIENKTIASQFGK